jgi:hypothetical protein
MQLRVISVETFRVVECTNGLQVFACVTIDQMKKHMVSFKPTPSNSDVVYRDPQIDVFYG